MTTKELESECPCQTGCDDFLPSESKKTCVRFQDGECWLQAWEDEAEEFEDTDIDGCYDMGEEF